MEIYPARNLYLRRLEHASDHFNCPDMKWLMPREEGDILITPEGYRWRIERTPTVGDLVHVGDTVRTSYGSGGLVINVSRYEVCCCLVLGFNATLCKPPLGDTPIMDYHRVVSIWTITYVRDDARQNSRGQFRDCDLNILNEFVAVGDRILRLFENNDDEVFLVNQSLRLSRPVQLGFSL